MLSSTLCYVANCDILHYLTLAYVMHTSFIFIYMGYGAYFAFLLRLTLIKLFHGNRHLAMSFLKRCAQNWTGWGNLPSRLSCLAQNLLIWFLDCSNGALPQSAEVLDISLKVESFSYGFLVGNLGLFSRQDMSGVDTLIRVLCRQDSKILSVIEDVNFQIAACLNQRRVRVCM
ncbi:hypothetical protein OIU85_024346 [Salix viminalis]|uniref:Uncharacterized protein n=1 Tax=Salix viminalis TaxID=40686 RepID=A0A9Q0U0K8_SALVM|nr:hypothetical protein OIU85_024346 [Salix viminalis]